MNIIGIIGAMDEEVSILKEKMEIIQVVNRAAMEFNRGILNGKEVVVVTSGIGKVNAGICTQILVDLFSVTHIINTGIAGGLRDEINIGDIVISKEAIHHDMNAVEFGYELGQIPRMDTLAFPSDETLMELAMTVCEEVNPEINVFKGCILTGDQFIAEPQVKKHLIETFKGLCVEMEGAAIAQGAYLNKVPYVIIRAISDKADNSATVDYPTFAKAAIRHSVRLVEGMLAKM
jgi:5''-methylthioadenosine/S-adenosylhomocysteine nucleosidase